jgi:hypothetical protein
VSVLVCACSSVDSCSSSSSSSMKNTFVRPQSDSTMEIATVTMSNDAAAGSNMNKEKGKARRWTNAFNKKA